MFVNYSLVSMVALANIQEAVEREMKARVEGDSNYTQNVRQALIDDGVEHGVTYADAEAQVDSWIKNGVDLDALMNRVAASDLATGEPSFTLNTPDAFTISSAMEDTVAEEETVIVDEGEPEVVAG